MLDVANAPAVVAGTVEESEVSKIDVTEIAGQTRTCESSGIGKVQQAAIKPPGAGHPQSSVQLGLSGSLNLLPVDRLSNLVTGRLSSE